MYVYNHRTGTPVSQGYAPNAGYGSAQGYGVNPAFVPPPGVINAAAPPPSAAFVPPPGIVTAPVPISTPRHTPTPPPPALNPVQVPAGCYPVELVQFWKNEYKPGNPFPLHWALFVRTTSPSSSPSPPLWGSTLKPGGRTNAHAPAHAKSAVQTPQGNFYELVGTTETYTAQFLAGVTFTPESLPDWRGTHVIGWVHPAQLSAFERAVRQVPVWRRRPEWRCQQWVYEVVCALAGRREGVYVDGCSFGGMQKQMGWLLEAWENGDI